MVEKTVRVASTCIYFAAYDPDRETLRLTYTGGQSYTYFGLPNYVYAGLLTAPTKGKYVNAVIKGYPFSRG
jgi:KTSC domain